MPGFFDTGLTIKITVIKATIEKAKETITGTDSRLPAVAGLNYE
jgi:hypothetical protein